MKERSHFCTSALLIMLVLLTFASSCKKDDDDTNDDDNTTPPVTTVTDIDGNVYNTITIGSQVWMVENLRVTRYRNGDPIPNVTDNTAWANLASDAYCEYDNNGTYVTTYGRLYNWYAATDSRGIAPTGWHVPSDAEWTMLETYLEANGFNYDGATVGNKYAKALAATTNWATSTIEGAVGNTDYAQKRNVTGFTGLPGGTRGFDGTFYENGSHGYWWSSTENGVSNAFVRYLRFDEIQVCRYGPSKVQGFSIRCIKD